MRVVIAGGGALGLQVLRNLAEHERHELVVVEVDEQIAEAVADDFDALVIAGDASDPDILAKGQIDQAHALVAVTGSDPINTVIAMLGHRFEVPRIVVKLTSNALRGALEEIGVSEIVAPTMAAANKIAAVVHGSEGADSQLLPASLQSTDIAVGRGVEGKKIADLDLPDEALLVAVVRDDTASLARGDTVLRGGDVVVAVAESEDALERCHRLLARN